MNKENREDNKELQTQALKEDREEQADLGYKFLSDALRASFFLLKIIMIVLLGFFMISGFETVGPDEKALVLQFGKIQGTGEERILGPGLTWVWPYPVEEIIRIPVAKKVNLAIDSLWYYEKPEDKLRSPREAEIFSQTLNPIRDGYCLTRSEKDNIAGSSESDYNIVHTKWQLTYQISDPELFFKNVYVDLEGIEAGQNYSDVITKNVTPVLKDLVSDSVVTALVNYTIDDVLFEQISTITEHVKKILQQKLDKIESGIKVVSIQLDDKIWPRQVNDAFWASIKATNIKEKTVSEAKTYAEKTLNEAKGLEAEEIAQAKAYRRKVVEVAKANADYFKQLLPEYRERPELVVQRIYQEAVKEVLSNSDEKMIIQPTEGARGKEIRILLNRDPAIKKKSGQQEEQ